MLTVSVIIPTKNESQDIRETIETCLRLDGPLKEIIVVDDSDDDTPEIIRGFADERVILAHRPVNRNGCCGARSEGLRTARGEISVLMNADARPSPDLLTRMIPHYENGADFLVIGSRVRNRENMWGSYIQARTNHYSVALQEWSEGFSCRTAAAAGLQDFPGDYPVPFCRDYLLGAALRAAGFRRAFDASITIEHVAPDTLRTYWKALVWRGTFLAPTVYFIRRRTVSYTIVWTSLKALYELAQVCTIAALLARAIRLKRLLGHDGSVHSLFLAESLTRLAIAAGNIKGLFLLLRHIGGQLRAGLGHREPSARGLENP
jgi:glycosyltransferase involved in cell wall biosynthesis